MTMSTSANQSTINRGTLVVIVGPTGCGKTDFSISLAQQLCAPIISTDSRQFFQGIPIGTAQPDESQLKAVKHYFIADRELSSPQTCGNYEREALVLLDKLFTDNQFVIAAGGSGLYVDALCKGMDNLPDIDLDLRSQLNTQFSERGLPFLCDELKEKDPEYYAQVDRSNPQRVIRALEVCLQTGLPYSSFRSGKMTSRPFNIVKIGIEMDRELLYERINRRVDNMLAEGLEAEARSVYPYRELNSLQTVGYRELFDYFDGKISFTEAVELIKRNSRRYAKRQLTWFKRDQSTMWVSSSSVSEVKTYILGFVSDEV